ncbi:MAG: dihydrofolate reductase family protein [Nanoarchaeota archaeon]|nr:dihydrofolate reductase family protein [Nanoarchaeota archaeon]MBU1322313.1 dihydrofolate reductase family protein [Nanoarchaeota archaeon]MBU1597852.1 dihydrofolate reductase family protein [Nanoarchaeota archaeon]MBU2441439.1 dihydrofolate reductase family protein [Nanoarchaeota archaeon]
MKVTLFMAVSLNGFIARKDGEEDFLSHDNWNSFSELVNSHKNFVIGRKTYEAVKKWGEEYSFDDFTNAKKIVVSKNKDYKLDKGYILASSPEEAINIFKEQGAEKALITGGSNLNTAFAKKGLINEIILNIEPKIIGEGIPLFFTDKFDLELELKDIKELGKGLLQVRYEVG